MTARSVSEQDALNVINAVGIPPIPDEVLRGDGTVPEFLSRRLSEVAARYDEWCFYEEQNSDLAAVRSATEIEKKALKLLAEIGAIGEGGVPVRPELGRGSMYSFALLDGGKDPGRNFAQAVTSVEKLARWAGETRKRAEADRKRKTDRRALSAALHSPPADRLLWVLAKTYAELWNRQPGYSTPGAPEGSWGRDGPFIRFLGACMPLFGIHLSADGYQKRWSRLLQREAEESE